MQGLHHLSGFPSDCKYWKWKLYSFLWFWVYFLTKHVVAKGSSSVSSNSMYNLRPNINFLFWVWGNFQLHTWGVFCLIFAVLSCLKQQKCSSLPGKVKKTALYLKNIIKLTFFLLPLPLSTFFVVPSSSSILWNPLRQLKADGKKEEIGKKKKKKGLKGFKRDDGKNK